MFLPHVGVFTAAAAGRKLRGDGDNGWLDVLPDGCLN